MKRTIVEMMTLEEAKGWIAIIAAFLGLSGWAYKLQGNVAKNCKAINKLSSVVFPGDHDYMLVTRKECKEDRGLCGSDRRKEYEEIKRLLEVLPVIQEQMGRFDERLKAIQQKK